MKVIVNLNMYNHSLNSWSQCAMSIFMDIFPTARNFMVNCEVVISYGNRILSSRWSENLITKKFTVSQFPMPP